MGDRCRAGRGGRVDHALGETSAWAAPYYTMWPVGILFLPNVFPVRVLDLPVL